VWWCGGGGGGSVQMMLHRFFFLKKRGEGNGKQIQITMLRSYFAARRFQQRPTETKDETGNLLLLYVQQQRRPQSWKYECVDTHA
jgi:hypothetical protein